MGAVLIVYGFGVWVAVPGTDKEDAEVVPL
jgi:hypothetical protein